MTDWDQLHEVGHQTAPPPFESLVHTARRRDRRARTLRIAAAAAVLAVGGFGVAAIVDDDPTVLQPAAPPSKMLPDGVAPLPENDPGRDFATIAAGRYRVPLSDTLAFDVALPSDTSAHDHGLFIATRSVVLKVIIADETYGVPHDACAAHGLDPAGTGVDDLVRAIRKQRAYETSRPVPVQIGGATGTYLEIRVRRSFDASRCEGGRVASPGTSTTSYPWRPGFRGNYAILDVDGQRVVVAQECTCREAALDEAAPIARSITFAPAT